MRKMGSLVAAVAIASLSTIAQAGVVAGADVAGLATFQDTSTNRTWLRIDDFFDPVNSTSSMTTREQVVAAQAAGFTWASQSDIDQLFATLPLDGGQWAAYAQVMGAGETRSLIWGAYDNANGGAGWGYSFSSDGYWSAYDSGNTLDQISAGNGPGAQDLGVWAFRTSAVPEPATWMMMGAAVFMAAAARRRKA